MTADLTQATRAAMPANGIPQTSEATRLRTSNRRTALVLAAIAVIFFVGVIATKFMGGPILGIGILGSAVLLFLVVAIGRNLRDNG